LTGPGRFLAVIAVVIGSAASIHAEEINTGPGTLFKPGIISIEYPLNKQFLLPEIPSHFDAPKWFTFTSNLSIKGTLEKNSWKSSTYYWNCAGQGDIVWKIKSGAHWPGKQLYSASWCSPDPFGANNGWGSSPTCYRWTVSYYVDIYTEVEGEATGGGRIEYNSLTYNNKDGKLLTVSPISLKGSVKFIPKATFTPVICKRERIQLGQVTQTLIFPFTVEIEAFVGLKGHIFTASFDTLWSERKQTWFKVQSGPAELQWGGAIKLVLANGVKFAWNPTWSTPLWKGFDTKWPIDLQSTTKLVHTRGG
jgi:hypothetical protein